MSSGPEGDSATCWTFSSNFCQVSTPLGRGVQYRLPLKSRHQTCRSVTTRLRMPQPGPEYPIQLSASCRSTEKQDRVGRTQRDRTGWEGGAQRDRTGWEGHRETGQGGKEDTERQDRVASRSTVRQDRVGSRGTERQDRVGRRSTERQDRVGRTQRDRTGWEGHSGHHFST